MFRPLLALAFVAATITVAPAHASSVTTAAAPSATATAYITLGEIASDGFPESVKAAADGTVYVPTQSGNYVA